jgi:hypothetical protein
VRSETKNAVRFSAMAGSALLLVGMNDREQSAL